MKVKLKKRALSDEKYNEKIQQNDIIINRIYSGTATDVFSQLLPLFQNQIMEIEVFDDREGNAVVVRFTGLDKKDNGYDLGLLCFVGTFSLNAGGTSGSLALEKTLFTLGINQEDIKNILDTDLAREELLSVELN